MNFRVLIAFLVLTSFSSCAIKPTELPIETKNKVIRSEGERVLLDYALSPSGDRLALFDNTGVYIYDLNSMEETVFLEFGNGNYTTIRSGAVAFHPDGEQIAISGKFDEEEVSIWNITSKKPLAIIDNLPAKRFVTEVAFSPNGKSFLVRDTTTEAGSCEGYISDKVILRRIDQDESLFEIDKCSIYPPIYFRFTADEKLFLYVGYMAPEHTVYFIESNTGKIISQSVHYWTDDGDHFYDVSPDGNAYLVEKIKNEKRITYLLDSKSNDVLNTVEGKIVLLREGDGLIVSSYNPNPQWSFWEDGKFQCTYDGVNLSPEMKASANGEVIAIKESDTELQVWRVSTCEMIGKFQFDTGTY
jgi:WD40 repeat protein